MTMMMNMNMMMIMVLINYEIASITGCASFVLACFCFVFLCMIPSSLCNSFLFFSFVLSFFSFLSLSLLSLFRLYSVFPPTRFKIHHKVSIGPRISHAYQKNKQPFALAQSQSFASGVVLGDCRVGFCNVSCRFTLFSTHSLIAQCRLHHSISPQSVIGGDMNRAVPLQPHDQISVGWASAEIRKKQDTLKQAHKVCN